MKRPMQNALIRLTAVVAAVSALSACNAMQRMAEVGAEPKLANIENPVEQPNYQPVSMPMPAPQAVSPNPNSLWRPGARAFFKDQRAAEVGDILTVKIDISSEKAKLSNSTTRTRGDVSETANLTSFLGYENALGDVLPESVDPTSLIDLGSDSSYTGDGEIDREETVNLSVAAVVTQVLPNGNLVIAGRQEIRVNYELRQINLRGVIRPQDITSSNTIQWDQIAEARIAYGGRGTISDVQQPRYGQQIYDIIFPF